MRLYQKIAVLSITLLAPVLAYGKLPDDPAVRQWSYIDTKAFEAWDATTGSRDVVVAIVDNGFDTFHPDLFPNVWKNEDEIEDNGVDDDNNGYIDDVWGWDFAGVDRNGDGAFEESELKGDNDPRPDVTFGQPGTIFDEEIHHATAIAGIIGAVGNNGMDGSGLNWRVRLMNVKALERAGVNDLDALTNAIRYGVDNGADVINISLVGDVHEKIKEAVKYAYDKGVVVVAAVGNTRLPLNELPLYPVCADANETEQWVIGVSAIKEDRRLAGFSNRGSACVDITSPGTGIKSTLRYAPRHGLTERYGGKWQGTSFAAPFVSGAAALIKAVQPGWGPNKIIPAILKNTHRTPPNDPVAYQNAYGAGLLQIDKAVAYALSFAPKSKIDTFAAADVATGLFTALGDDAIHSKHRVALAHVSNVASYSGGYATFRLVKRGIGEVVIYSRDWEMENHWIIPSTGKMAIAAGDIIGDKEPEILVAPETAGREVWRIYSRRGELLKRFELQRKHAGVSIALFPGSGKAEIMALYSDNGEYTLHHFDSEFSEIRNFIVSFASGFGSVGAGDIDGDGDIEYVVGAAAGQEPFVGYFDTDGSLLRKFYVYDGGYQSGFSLTVRDYDQDGKDDVLTVPKAGAQDVRVWNNRSQKLGSWRIPGNDLRGFSI